MQYRTLGRTGIKVSPYALGALMLGASIGNPDHDDSIRIIHAALDAGINFIDTADVYSNGASEEVVGKALNGRRDNVVLATKLSRPMGDDPNQQGASRRWIMTAVENSLRRLQTDHIDLYQIHRTDPDTDTEETLSALSDLVHSGKVRAIGSSTTPASDMVEAQWVAERRGLQRFRTEQPPYSILDRGIESEVLPLAQRYGMARSCGARSRRACSPAASARVSRAISAAQASSGTSTTSAGSTPSSSSLRSPRRRVCR
jgi:aryl-alcohol dehydrogenase-like predicted oxidoreductase